jgi:hypothetical protein
MLSRVTIAALVTLLLVMCASNGFAGELDGTQWKASPAGWRAILFWQSDTLKFDQGKFESAVCIPFGFTAGPYESSRTNGGVTWSATQKNDKNETMRWEGTLSDGQLSGTYTWTKANGKSVTVPWKARKIT